jgi:hypothetical protein
MTGCAILHFVLVQCPVNRGALLGQRVDEMESKLEWQTNDKTVRVPSGIMALVEVPLPSTTSSHS